LSLWPRTRQAQGLASRGLRQCGSRWPRRALQPLPQDCKLSHSAARKNRMNKSAGTPAAAVCMWTNSAAMTSLCSAEKNPSCVVTVYSGMLPDSFRSAVAIQCSARRAINRSVIKHRDRLRRLESPAAIRLKLRYWTQTPLSCPRLARAGIDWNRHSGCRCTRLFAPDGS
jgi:hypothetical protein